MLLLCPVGLQLKVAKRIVRAAELREQKNLVAEATEEPAGRQLRADVA